MTLLYLVQEVKEKRSNSPCFGHLKPYFVSIHTKLFVILPNLNLYSCVLYQNKAHYVQFTKILMTLLYFVQKVKEKR